MRVTPGRDAFFSGYAKKNRNDGSLDQEVAIVRAPICLLCLLLLFGGPAAATVIGHNDIAQVAGLSQSVLDAIGQQRWLFAHASVGENIIGGMVTLNTANPVRYQLKFVTSGNGSAIYAPPANTGPGTVYDGSRGNPGWAAKYTLFDDAVRTLGWHYPKIDMAMDKLCFIDDAAQVNVYLASMTALENDYPATKFIYTTQPLQASSIPGSANIAYWHYNQAVRQHCSANGRILFDIADIESHDPQGNAITFTDQGLTYERLYSGYAADIGHLNAAGSERVALAWYALAATLAAPAATALPAEVAGATRITSVVPNPFNPITTINFRLANAGRAQLVVFDASGRQIERLLDTDLEAGDHDVIWRGRDRAGRNVAAGIYLIRLTAGGETSVRRVALAR